MAAIFTIMASNLWGNSRYGAFLAAKKPKTNSTSNDIWPTRKTNGHEYIDLTDDSPLGYVPRIKKEETADGRKKPKSSTGSFLLPKLSKQVKPVENRTGATASGSSRLLPNGLLLQDRSSRDASIIPRSRVPTLNELEARSLNMTINDTVRKDTAAPTADMRGASNVGTDTSFNSPSTPRFLSHSSTNQNTMFRNSPSPPLFVSSDEAIPISVRPSGLADLERMSGNAARSVLGLDPTLSRAEREEQSSRRDRHATEDGLQGAPLPPSPPKPPNVGLLSQRDRTPGGGGRQRLSDEERRRRAKACAARWRERQLAERPEEFRAKKRAATKRHLERKRLREEGEETQSVSSTLTIPPVKRHANPSYPTGPSLEYTTPRNRTLESPGRIEPYTVEARPERGLPLLVYEERRRGQHSFDLLDVGTTTASNTGAASVQRESSNDETLYDSEQEREEQTFLWHYFVVLRGQVPPSYGSASIAIRELADLHYGRYLAMEEANAQALTIAKEKYTSEYIRSFGRNPRQRDIEITHKFDPIGMTTCSFTYQELYIETKVVRELAHHQKLPLDAVHYHKWTWIVQMHKEILSPISGSPSPSCWRNVLGVYTTRELANQKAAHEWTQQNEAFLRELDDLDDLKLFAFQAQVRDYLIYLEELEDEDDPAGLFYASKEWDGVREAHGEADAGQPEGAWQQQPIDAAGDLANAINALSAEGGSTLGTQDTQEQEQLNQGLDGAGDALDSLFEDNVDNAKDSVEGDDDEWIALEGPFVETDELMRDDVDDGAADAREKAKSEKNIRTDKLAQDMADEDEGRAKQKDAEDKKATEQEGGRGEGQDVPLHDAEGGVQEAQGTDTAKRALEEREGEGNESEQPDELMHDAAEVLGEGEAAGEDSEESDEDEHVEENTKGNTEGNAEDNVEEAVEDSETPKLAMKVRLIIWVEKKEILGPKN